MKKVFFAIAFLCGISTAQYYGERTTEQSFEPSEVYFKSNLLNPFGLSIIGQISPYTIDNPFLKLMQNPADLYSDKQSLLLYIDFRGEREVRQYYDHVMPLYNVSYSSSIAYDYRWMASPQAEPEPFVSLGFLKYVTDKLMIGGTYQLINNKSNYYSSPYSYYGWNPYYDGFGIRTMEASAGAPTVDRYSGNDNLKTKAHFVTLYTGYQISDELSTGLTFSYVNHSRNGEYGNTTHSGYSSTGLDDYYYSNQTGKDHSYSHYDISAGIKYLVNPKTSVGIKAGFLSGNGNQLSNSFNDYQYKNNTPNVSSDWNYSYSKSSSEQKYDQDGKSFYAGLNINHQLNESTTLLGYYDYRNTNIDLSNSSLVVDTSNYNNRWSSSYNNVVYNYSGISSIIDQRIGSGTRKISEHKIFGGVKVELTPSSSVTTGIFYSSNSIDVNSTEPVKAYRYSKAASSASDNSHSYNYEYLLIEDKRLEWNYTSVSSSIQIPVVLNFVLNQNWTMILGINKVMNDWEVKQQTNAHFTLRDKTDNGVNNKETNFIERYTSPDESYTEEYTHLFIGFEANISKMFTLRILVEPELFNAYSEFSFMNQWWLGFEVRL
ncbi:MAG: hypothetical protein Q8N03_10845 [Ignavibacteria bacterium]|nr:hypothetical protein [Ignavibacteria bacterium]